MKISIASDHGGFLLKEEVRKYLAQKYEVIDDGCYSTDRVDYPMFADKVCVDMQNKKADVGVLICTSGIGMSICANKHKGIRAALVMNEDAAKFSRLHNDANVICMGAKYLNKDEACHYVEIFLSTEFEGGRHQNRVDMINNLDK